MYQRSTRSYDFKENKGYVVELTQSKKITGPGFLRFEK